ncbi:Transmembrane protein 266 [Collichthys lucidus]|uniref:Transmembrane protein 266 n=1 Tax=Collichthys lucidus TaxID=240159 RepID=A0A4V6AMS4_COLLU|nr:Transmembrane protein 266 [Collichthys lucidus]
MKLCTVLPGCCCCCCGSGIRTEPRASSGSLQHLDSSFSQGSPLRSPGKPSAEERNLDLDLEQHTQNPQPGAGGGGDAREVGAAAALVVVVVLVQCKSAKDSCSLHKLQACCCFTYSHHHRGRHYYQRGASGRHDYPSTIERVKGLDGFASFVQRVTQCCLSRQFEDDCRRKKEIKEVEQAGLSDLEIISQPVDDENQCLAPPVQLVSFGYRDLPLAALDLSLAGSQLLSNADEDENRDG